MRVVHERCAALDVHKKTVVACAMTAQGRETVTFGTMTRDLTRLAEWLTERGVRVVAMESTGVYWKPIVCREAPRIRVGMKRPHPRPVAAGRRSWGQSELGDAREGGSSPDNDGTGRYCQTARVRKRDGKVDERRKQWWSPRKASAGSKPGGSGPVRSA